MNSAHQHIRNRYILLVTIFLLLVVTLVLVYTHPDKKKRPLHQDSTYETDTLYKWHTQLTRLLQQQDYPTAELLAKNILLSTPDDIFAQRVQICCRLARNDRKGAIEMCQKILLSFPGDAITRNNLAVLLYATSPQEAANAAATALELAPENPAVRSNAIHIRNRLKTQTIQCDIDTLLLKPALTAKGE